MSERYDVIIIGAGMSGLAAGIRLAMFGKRTLILERHYAPGGLNSYYHRHRRPFDVGLHAMTNFVKRGTKRAPLTKLLRQLRIPYDAFRLCEQHGSQIHFPDVQLGFGNDFEQLREGIHAAFPDDADGFDRMVQALGELDSLSLERDAVPSRPFLEEHLRSPLLIDMLYCPLMFYGSAEENEMELGQLQIMFQSIYQEGFARPDGGVRTIIDALMAKYTEAGGELRYKCGVDEILTSDGKVQGVRLSRERGVTKTGKRGPKLVESEELFADVVISSAGWPETIRLTPALAEDAERAPVGRLSFVESIMVLDQEPKRLGLDKTIIFYNDSETFDYACADDLLDLRSGVICVPNNYAHTEPLPEGLLRVTNIASYERWAELDKPEPYNDVKLAWYHRQREKLSGILGSTFNDHVVCEDVFSPTTITHFTDHMGGAIYGSPKKVRDGRTRVDGLFLCGTDQGFLGIVGAMLSGISIANARVLQGS